MMNYDCWKKFVKTGKVDDYLHYIACTNEENVEDFMLGAENSIRSMDNQIQTISNPMKSIGDPM